MDFTCDHAAAAGELTLSKEVVLNNPELTQPRYISLLTLRGQPEAMQLALAEATIVVSDYFYAVDLGPSVRPQHHRVGKNAECTCFLAERCPAVDAVRAYLKAGGDRVPDPPPGYYPVHPAKCPICGAETAREPQLSSKRRGAGWRCLKGGTAHYWQKMGQVLAEKYAAKLWLTPPVVLRAGQQCFAWEGIQDGDQVLYPGIRRSETNTLE
jgi:hypothetical protein